MPLGTATSKTFQITYFWLQTAHDFVDCVEQLFLINCIGTINTFPLAEPGTYGWQLTVTGPVLADGLQNLVCNLNDVLLWDGESLRKTDYTTFGEQYTT